MDALSQKPVKGSRLSGRVGLSLTESGQDGESDRDRAGNVVESSSRVLPTGSDQVEREKNRRRGCRSGPPTLVVDSCTRKRRAGTGRQKWGASQKGGNTVSQQQSGQRVSCFLRGEEKRSGRLYLTLRRRYQGKKDQVETSQEPRSSFGGGEGMLVRLFCNPLLLGQAGRARAIREGKFGVGFLGRTRWFVGRRLVSF